MKLTIQLQQAQLKRQALLSAGLDPQAQGQKPGSRVHRNRKRDLDRGIVKHRARAFD